jgi:hypothetical protein
MESEAARNGCGASRAHAQETTARGSVLLRYRGLMPFLERIAEIDRVVESRVATRRTGGLDDLSHVLSSAADRTKLWVGLAGLRAATDRRTGRRAAARMIVVVGLQSLILEMGVKRLFRRSRPLNEVRLRFRTRRPLSTSFPSGHSASAATAAILLADGKRGWGPPLAVVAAGVAWSRIQTGLHHFSDVVAGLLIGTITGVLLRRRWPLTPGT